MVFLDGSDGKESTCNAGDLGLIPGLGRSLGEGNGNPLQYSCLKNSVDRGAWRAMGSMGSQRARHTERLTHTHTGLCSAARGLQAALSHGGNLSLGSRRPGRWVLCLEPAGGPSRPPPLPTLSLKNGDGVHPCRGSLIHGEGVCGVPPPGWVLRSHKSLGSSPVLALVFRLVCGDNGQGRRMTQVRGKVEWLAGAKLAHGGAGCWLGSEEPWALWSNAVVSLCLGFEDTYGLG